MGPLYGLQKTLTRRLAEEGPQRAIERVSAISPSAALPLTGLTLLRPCSTSAIPTLRRSSRSCTNSTAEHYEAAMPRAAHSEANALRGGAAEGRPKQASDIRELAVREKGARTKLRSLYPKLQEIWNTRHRERKYYFNSICVPLARTRVCA